MPMPKRVDHAERRRHIAEAVLRLVAVGGMDAVSLRDVAAEASVSMGMVQHYFHSKDRMLLFACDYLLERTRRRIQEEIAALPAPRTVRATLRAVFLETLPLDEERRAGARVWLAFLARAAVEPDLEAFMRSTWVESHAFIAVQIQLAQQRGDLPACLNPDRETVSALSLVDGLVSHVLFGHYSPGQATAAVEDHLDRLFSATRGA
jgi:AcrR family transcriptional regulator